MPHGGREQSPRSSKLGPAGRGRVFKNSRLRPTESRNLQVAIQQFATFAATTPTPSAFGGAGEEFFPPRPPRSLTPRRRPRLHCARRWGPAWPAAMLEPIDVVPTTATPDTGASHPTTVERDAGPAHPPSAIPRPTPRPHADAAQPAATAAAAPRATAPRAPAPAPAAGQKPRKPQPAAAPPRPQRPPKKPTAIAPAAPMRPAPLWEGGALHAPLRRGVQGDPGIPSGLGEEPGSCLVLVLPPRGAECQGGHPRATGGHPA
ncbi:translation initiation factor IF-2-like [Spodoptera frugiperda]|uniref:Translation initiation factor IF-2-like n=1 Tax=Spodoptera frugiperda TaxID=7108 RepID=A0A9R0F1A5_SPOFR|nr:translation initiation factor IF-2-like [Spodoptera frugiperda]